MQRRKSEEKQYLMMNLSSKSCRYCILGQRRCQRRQKTALKEQAEIINPVVPAKRRQTPDPNDHEMQPSAQPAGRQRTAEAHRPRNSAFRCSASFSWIAAQKWRFPGIPRIRQSGYRKQAGAEVIDILQSTNVAEVGKRR